MSPRLAPTVAFWAILGSGAVASAQPAEASDAESSGDSSLDPEDLEGRIERALLKVAFAIQDAHDEEAADDDRGHAVHITAGTSASSDAPVEILVPLAFFASIVGVVALVQHFRSRSERVRHETVRQAMERGVDIPVELLLPPGRKRSDLRRGVVLIGGGLGLIIMLGLLDDGRSWAVGLFPAMIGAGYLLSWWLEGRHRSGSYPS